MCEQNCQRHKFWGFVCGISKNNPLIIGTKVFFGGTIPFKSTPMNIVRRGVRYSPVGLAESLTKGFYDLRKGNINANQLIDNISQGLSGTSIFALGAFMGYMGWINGVSPENQKEEAWRSSQGWQNYSINLPGGGTYTIDWGGPSTMALLAGVETAQLHKRVVIDDLRAAGTARAPAPGGLSLLSREYSNVSEFMTPPTPTLLPDYPAMAAHALELIEMFLQRKQPPGDIACPGRLLIRDSVRDLRNQNFTTG